MGLIDLVFPKKCLECGKTGKYICLDCLAKVHSSTFKLEKDFKGVISLWVYEGVIRKAIIALKYKFAYDIAKELADLGCFILKTKWPTLNNKILLPIPLHIKRKNWRGFNQAETIGKIIAEKMGWQFKPNLLIKNKATKPQVGLKGKDRKINLENSFILNPHYSQATNHDSLILFDDVWTTGSTMKEAVRVLKHSGAKEIWGLTIAD